MKCDQCGFDRELWPVTRYSPKVGHHVGMRVCHSCLGPWESPNWISGINFAEMPRPQQESRK